MRYFIPHAYENHSKTTFWVWESSIECGFWITNFEDDPCMKVETSSYTLDVALRRKADAYWSEVSEVQFLQSYAGQHFVDVGL